MDPAPDETAVQVRAATRADLEAIAALDTGARAAHHHVRFPGTPFDAPAEHLRCHLAWSHALHREDTPVLCAVRHGTVLGAAAYRGRHTRATVKLDQLHVDPAHWGTGVGRALHTACLHAWRSAGFARAVLDVRWHNHRARGFYAGLGWRPDRRPAPDATHLTLRLDLAPGAPPTPGSPPAAR
ncbi:GNAT family N-acetyltransferase [Streptomyces sp. NPDC059008]|uniref:GNAT family N-acetyltransferase n=1 Tax=Streptomyces sp. NPDC059008 TaxID=3346693 RepID=UPI0036D000DE